MLNINITNDNRLIANQLTIANSVNYERVKFHFPDFWDGYSKTAVFSYEGQTPINVVLEEENELVVAENECLIPFEVIKSPCFNISVFGVKGDSRITTTMQSIEVLESGYYPNGEAPLEPTPSEYEQIINIMSETKTTAESVRADANAGLFKGDKGEKGDKGDKGIQGEKGEKGEPGEVTLEYANNNFAPTLKVLKSGENVVSVTDVSPLEHSLDVNVESKTETVTRTVIEPYGENLLTKEIISAGELIGDYDNTLLSVSYDAEQGAVVINGTLEKDKYFVWNMENSGISNIKITNSVVSYGLPENTIEGLMFSLVCWDETNENSMIVDFVGDLNVNDSGTTYTPTVFAIYGNAFDNDIVYDNVVIKPELYYCEYDVVTEDVTFVPDLTKVTVSRLRKNLINPAKVVENSQAGSLNTTWLGEECFMYNVFRKDSATNDVLSGVFKKNTQYTLSAEVSGTYKNNPSNELVILRVRYTDGTSNDIRATVYPDKFQKITFTTKANKTISRLFIAAFAPNAYLYAKNMQFEEGATATEYQPYSEPTVYPVNADGTVEGVVSIASSMTFVSDTEGVIIKVGYNADTKLYIDNLIAEKLNG